MNSAAHLQARRRERQAIADTSSVLTRCAFCDWTLDATLGEGRLEYERHRKLEHRAVKPASRLKVRNLRRWSQQELTKDERAEIDAERRTRALMIGLGEVE